MNKALKRANKVFNRANALQRQYLAQAAGMGVNPYRKSLRADLLGVARRVASSPVQERP